jgi:hypothetical protein
VKPPTPLEVAVDLRLQLDGRPLHAVAVFVRQVGQSMEIDVFRRDVFFAVMDARARKEPATAAMLASLASEIRAQPKRCPVLVLQEGQPPQLRFRGLHLAGHHGDAPADVEARSNAALDALEHDRRPILGSAVVLEQDDRGWSVCTLSRESFLEITDRHALTDADPDRRAALTDIAAKVRAQPMGCPVVLIAACMSRLGWLFVQSGAGGDA